MKEFQRKGSISNAHVGRDFVELAKKFFEQEGITLGMEYGLPIGVGQHKKKHCYDLGCSDKRIIIECKSHKWTESDKVPSAKMTVWNQEMFYFLLAPKEYRKIFFILKDFSRKRKETLGQYYIRTYDHLIPYDVEFWEYDEQASTAHRIK